MDIRLPLSFGFSTLKHLCSCLCPFTCFFNCTWEKYGSNIFCQIILTRRFAPVVMKFTCFSLALRARRHQHALRAGILRTYPHNFKQNLGTFENYQFLSTHTLDVSMFKYEKTNLTFVLPMPTLPLEINLSAIGALFKIIDFSKLGNLMFRFSKLKNKTKFVFLEHQLPLDMNMGPIRGLSKFAILSTHRLDVSLFFKISKWMSYSSFPWPLYLLSPKFQPDWTTQ